MMSYKNMDDKALLEELKRNVARQNGGGRARATSDPFGVCGSISAIFERLAADGLEKHQLFQPVAQAMAELPGDSVNDSAKIARALSGVLAGEKINPWRAIVNGQKSGPKTPKTM